MLDAILLRELLVDLEVCARYLCGNVAFFDRNWQSAIDDYDKALLLILGLPVDAGDGIGRDAVHNCAFVLCFCDEDQKCDVGVGGVDVDVDGDVDGDVFDVFDGNDVDADVLKDVL